MMKRAFGVATLLAALTLATPALAGPAAISACGTTISASGSYVVTKNLTVKAPKHGSPRDCITINASGVTLDLGGYNINCNGIPVKGVVSIGSPTNTGVTIRNGIIANCDIGVDTAGGDGLGTTGALIDEIIALSSPTGIGIDVGQKSTVIHSIANDNGDAGIFVWCPSNIIYNTAVNNIVVGTSQLNDLVYTGTDPCHFSCNAYDSNQILGTVGSCP